MNGTNETNWTWMWMDVVKASLPLTDAMASHTLLLERAWLPGGDGNHAPLAVGARGGWGRCWDEGHEY